MNTQPTILQFLYQGLIKCQLDDHRGHDTLINMQISNNQIYVFFSRINSSILNKKNKKKSHLIDESNEGKKLT